jgi:hypothetical protein
MTNANKYPWFRTGCVAAAVCLMICTSCALEALGLMQAVMTVGTDVHLPLERIATNNRKPTQVTDVSEPAAHSGLGIHACAIVGSFVDGEKPRGL